MRVPYRVTSCVAVGTLALAIASAFLPLPAARRVPASLTGDDLRFDPCSMWVQQTATERLETFVCLGAFVVFAVQGLRNRSGPRWLAVAGLPGLLFAILSDWWRISAGCYDAVRLTLSSFWVVATGAMFFHHAAQPSRRSRLIDPAVSQGKGLLAAAYRAAIPAFAAILVAWLILNEFRYLTYDGDDPTLAHSVIITVQRYVTWAGVVLFPFAVLAGMNGLISRWRGKAGT